MSRFRNDRNKPAQLARVEIDQRPAGLVVDAEHSTARRRTATPVANSDTGRH